MSGLGAGTAPAWVPTHVQVTVLRARGLRAKAAAGGGGSDAYTVMALGREKFSTSVAERCQGQPLWREEATFELPPPPRPAALRLTVLHRALVGLDKFLGRAEVDLAALRADGGRRHTRYVTRVKHGARVERDLYGENQSSVHLCREHLLYATQELHHVILSENQAFWQQHRALQYAEGESWHRFILNTAMSWAGELGAELPPAGRGVKPAAGPLLPDGKASDAAGCLPQSSSLVTATPPVMLRDLSSDRHSETEGQEDLSDCLPKLESAVPLAGERGLKLATLPVILEGGSDEELLGDPQEPQGLAAGEENLAEAGKQSLGAVPLHEDLQEHSGSSAAAALGGGGGSAAGACEPSKAPELPASVGVHSAKKQVAGPGLGRMSHSREQSSPLEVPELRRSAGAECAEHDFSEPSLSSSSLSSPPQPCSSSPPLPSDTPNGRAESPQKPPAEGSADKAGNCGKKKLLQAWVSPSEIYPNLSQQGAEPLAPKHRLHPVKPMNATANKPQSKTLNVISTMNEKLLEMNMKKYEPSDPAYAYAQLTHDELIQLVLKQKDTISRKDLQVRELEDYIDNLLVRVMEETPNILRVSTSGNKKAGKM
ncbi:rab11 family-interacting protein 1 [Indicator indicator]|uniref:rab11 family-interacting protein 1 n=1 Tax=Indicator indicator TaxID=1002788 RepID=UPI0023DFEB5B|nr:rab11 family-interacting protein 1 [Indicator indicator]